MTNAVVEWAPIKLRADKTEAEFLVASEVFQREFVTNQKGFIRRELIRTGEGEYADLIHWRNQEDADAVMQNIENSSACSAFFSFMEMNMDNADPSSGVAHYVSLAIYPNSAVEMKAK